MLITSGSRRYLAAAILIPGYWAIAQPQTVENPPDFIVQGRRMIQEGKPDEALALYRIILKSQPESVAANDAAGTVLDLMGKGLEAREHFQKVIDLARDPKGKAAAQRAMAMSWAFAGDCAETVKYEQMVIGYYASQKDFFQQGEIADEAARVCLDNGQFDTAYQWYFTGHDLGLKQPDITPDRKSLWEFRWEHAQARIAARKGNQTEADKHVAAAKALLVKDPEMAKGQAAFLPYLVGYVAFYRGDYETALAQLEKANQNDAFIQCLMAETYENLGQADKAKEFYQKAAAVASHNPPAAYARPRAMKKLAPKAEKPAGN